MKYITLLFAGLMVSGMASAVPLEESATVRMDQCQPLNENVRINLSSNVRAGVSCNVATVALSACHTGGKVTGRTVLLKNVEEDADAGIPAHKASCSEDGVDGCTMQTVTGPAMPAATTQLGTVNTQYPGGECTAAVAETNSTVMLAQ